MVLQYTLASTRHTKKAINQERIRHVARKNLARRQPVDIALHEPLSAENDVMFVRLPTLDQLEQFWNMHKDRFRFACEGKNIGPRPIFLREYEWVFGTSKAAVVQTVMRWGQSKIGVEYYDWAQSDPELYEAFVADHERDRHIAIERLAWSAEDEERYRRHPPQSQRGWWRFAGLPDGDDLGLSGEYEALHDPSLPANEVVQILQERAFEQWQSDDETEVRAHETDSVDETIRYWRGERAGGARHYGDENVVSKG